MLYYIVAEGRARTLDRLNLRDRATYGLDWMVFYASSAQDALRQWQQFKAGTHVRQADLELEAASYRQQTPEYVPVWEAESEAVAAKEADTLEDVEARLRVLESERDQLIKLRNELTRRAGGPVLRPARRQSTARTPSKRAPKKPGRRRQRAK